MYNKSVFPGKYIQGNGALNELMPVIKQFGDKGLIIASPSVKEKILPRYSDSLLMDKVFTETFRGECCEKEISRIEKVIAEKNINVLVGMGGGKTIDTTKIAADRAGIPVIIVPTIASTDAPCSGVAVAYTETGVYDKVYYQKLNPSVILVDTKIIAESPVRFLVAGMGDALATWFEANSCVMTQSVNECGGLSTLAGLNLARLCYETLLKYGVQAKMANEEKLITPAFNYIVETNILLSGIGFESGGLASAHSIHNGLTVLEETHSYYHGEKVAFGVITGLHLNSYYNDYIETVYSFCENVGLPTTLAEIGLNNSDKEKLMKAAESACTPGQFIHHEAGEITPGKILDAMLMADKYGRMRKLK